jgi:hypothetical protein
VRQAAYGVRYRRGMPHWDATDWATAIATVAIILIILLVARRRGG